MKIKDLLRNRRQYLGLSLKDVAEAVGVAEATVSRWEGGQINNMRRDRIANLAKVLKLDPSILMQDDVSDFDPFSIPNILPPPKMRAVPRIGSIACGEPILAQENIEGEDMVPENIECDFTLRCKGNSMINAHIHDGDIVCIKEQPEVENGQIAAVLIDGMETEATLKRFRRTGDTIILMPENPDYEPMVFTGEEMNRVHIVGLAVYYIARVR